MVSTPEPSTDSDPHQETSADEPISDGVPETDNYDHHSPNGPSESTTGEDQEEEASPSPEDDEDADADGDEDDVPTLLRSVEEEVDSADGDLETVEGESGVMGEGPLSTFTVETEEGLPGKEEDFAAAVEEILGDPRSWGNDGERSLQRVDDDDADFRVILAAPDTVDEMCAPLRTNGFVSCAQGNSAIINQNRWVSGVDHFEDDLETYRIYLINHEVGHTFGFGHVGCPGDGEPAPVMQQQTYGLQGCEANGWVHPDNDPDD